MIDDNLKILLKSLIPAIEASLDCICITDASGRIVHYNSLFKTTTQLRVRELSKAPLFDQVFRFNDGEGKKFSLPGLTRTGEAVKLDETPIQIKSDKGTLKIRGLLRIIPLEHSGQVIGTMVSLRDTTAELLLQAKYKKIQDQLVKKEADITQLREKVRALRNIISLA